MKKILTRVAAVLVAVFGIFVFTACGDEFANAKEITKAEALAYAQANEESEEELAQGYKMTMYRKIDGVESSMELQYVAGENDQIEQMAVSIKGQFMEQYINAKVYVKNNYLYVDAKIGENSTKTKIAYTADNFTQNAAFSSIALMQLPTMGETIFNLLEENSEEDGTVVVVKMLGDKESGNVKFQIKATKDMQNDRYESTAVVEYKANKLERMKVDATGEGTTVNFSAEKITSVSFPNLSYFN